MRPLHHRPHLLPPTGENGALPPGPRPPRSGGRKRDREQRRQDRLRGRRRPFTRPVRAGAGGGAVRENPPRPCRRQSAGHGRPPLEGRPRRPGLLIPPAPPGPRPRVDSPGGCRCRPRPARPAGRPPRPDSPGGCRCWPWPARTGAAPHPFRARRPAQPEPMGHPRPPPLTSPQQSPAVGGPSARRARSLVAATVTHTRARPERPRQPQRPGPAEDAQLWDDAGRKLRAVRAEKGGAAGQPVPRTRAAGPCHDGGGRGGGGRGGSVSQRGGRGCRGRRALRTSRN